MASLTSSPKFDFLEELQQQIKLTAWMATT
jgi:hypothetical protein